MAYKTSTIIDYIYTSNTRCFAFVCYLKISQDDKGFHNLWLEIRFNTQF